MAVKDVEGLDEVLARYPLSPARGAALLGRAQLYLHLGRAELATQDLRRAVGEALTPADAARALALLTQTEAELGALGAARAARGALRRRYPDTQFTLGTETSTGASWRFELPDVPDTQPEVARLQLPLELVHAESAEADSIYRAVVPIVDAAAGACPLALAMTGSRLRAIDLASGRVRWSAPMRAVSRALWTPGRVLVQPTSRSLIALDAKTGEVAWRRRFAQSLRRLSAHAGLVHSVHRNPTLSDAHARVRQIDARSGRVLWTQKFARAELGPAHVAGDVLWLKQRLRRPAVRTRILVLDSFSGELRHPIEVPASLTTEPIAVGDVVTWNAASMSAGTATYAGASLRTGKRLWERVRQSPRVVYAAPAGTTGIMLLHQQGEVLVLEAKSGEDMRTLQLDPRGGAEITPKYGTSILTGGGRLTLSPLARRSQPAVRSYRADSGKLAWVHGFPEKMILRAIHLGQAGEHTWCLPILHRRGSFESEFHVLDPGGRLVERVLTTELMGTRGAIGVQVGGGSVVLVGRNGLKVLR